MDFCVGVLLTWFYHRRRYNPAMPFLIKADFPTGHCRWLSAPRLGGIRTFVPREAAEVFETADKARAAIDEMKRNSLQVQGVALSITEIDDHSPA